ncbi:MAG TPA: acyl-ACP--UDP-N-acetylglucosamine O-acyltransferase [Verrucomicrobiota bacterium]|nr:acyl-[acyl-carrier-protein]--UDP-N-acetylglucosamine O-acyltransferase [Verrucomicrobiales bacterium]HRI12264.1 acyl-ACP--UDP-N-acetylglucosamine O-acyltransferase [Verrucomicrobiota bacterium]
MIHPTAVIHPDAQLGAGCSVGPYAVIDAFVVLGADCVVGAHAHLTGHTIAGARNRFHTGCVIGDAPQDFKYSGAPTRLRIGDDNVFREHVTVNRSTTLDQDTELGDGNFFMASCHVGHNSRIGNRNIIANGAQLAGHVELADHAFVSGNCLVHQFCRVGRLAMMQGGSAISKDLPPFCIARGDNALAGLNTVGLRRAGISSSERLALRSAYRELFRSGRRLVEAVAAVRAEFAVVGVVLELADFVVASKRGVCAVSSRAEADDEP